MSLKPKCTNQSFVGVLFRNNSLMIRRFVFSPIVQVLKVCVTV